MSFLSSVLGGRSGYDVWKLVNRSVFASDRELSNPVQIICDIDKTYLDTAFESVGGLAKIALESADNKRSIVGAREFLRHLKWETKPVAGAEDSQDQVASADASLHFVSSSPPQLRKVLREKIALDGLSWSSDSFKDQMYNIKSGKFFLLKHQVSYKLASILSLCCELKNPQRIVLIGDNAETDPFIYMILKALIELRFSPDELTELLKFLEVPKKVSERIFTKCSDFPGQTKVDIFIRNIPSYKRVLPQYFTRYVNVFGDYFEAALYAHRLGYLKFDSAYKIMLNMHNFSGHDLTLMGSLFSYYIEECGGNTDAVEKCNQDLDRLFHGRDLSVSYLSKSQTHFMGCVKSIDPCTVGDFSKAVDFSEFKKEFISWAKKLK